MNKFGIVSLCLFAVLALTASVNGDELPFPAAEPIISTRGMDGRAYSIEFIETIELNTTNNATVKTYAFINNQKMSWMEASYFCVSYGFELLSIENKLESDVITKYLVEAGNSQVQYWISGNKIGRSGYLWITNKFLNYGRWGTGEPNVPSVNCMILYNAFWYDAPCEGSFYFVCEK